MKLYRKKINGQELVRSRRNIVIRKDGMQIINPSEELILADGWEVYEPPTIEPTPYQPTERELLEELMKEDFNVRTTTSNEDALHYMLIVYPFEHYVGKSLKDGKGLKAGQLVTYFERIYRARQDIPVVLEEQYPSVDTAALYEVIEKEHVGTLEDPIPYTPPMAIFAGKYYSQNDALYLCTRDSSTALSHDLASLIGLYVELA